MSMHASDAPFMLSISGARGIVGASMTPIVASKFAAAFGSQLVEHTRRPRLAVGRDGRAGGEAFTNAVKGALMAVGCEVVDFGVTMTPSIGVMIRELKLDGGMCITASHNPLEWNGLKCLNEDGLAPPKADADAIIARFREERFAFVTAECIGSCEQRADANETHVAKVLALLGRERVAAIAQRRFVVVLDSVNASGCIPGRMLLERLGCTLVHINGEQTGVFAHRPEPIAENLAQLCDAVSSTPNAAIGFAQDPDADRLAIVDERGQFIGEEYTLVLGAMAMLAQCGATTMAANLSTSRMIDDVAARYPGASVARTAVGEAHVVAALKPSGGKIGGEGNGGVIVPEVCFVRDSLSAMALVLDLLASTPTQSLSRIVAGMPKYAMIKTKLDLSTIGGSSAVGAALEKVKLAFAHERCNASDGVRVDFADGWVHLRASNTEPIVRVIAEATTEQRAQELIRQCRTAAGLEVH